jgi:hypothetical protein
MLDIAAQRLRSPDVSGGDEAECNAAAQVMRGRFGGFHTLSS